MPRSGASSWTRVLWTAAIGLAVWAGPWCVVAADADPAAEAGIKAHGKMQVLAEHRTLARFEGAVYRLCRGLTANCPEKCGDSGEFATFSIVEYLHYRKPGEYGDPQQKQFLFQVSDFHRQPKGDPKLLKAVQGLKKGDLVLLEWRHLYGELLPGAFSPVRPVTQLRAVTDDEAAKLRAAAKTQSH
jgi:hypothetical protein